MKGQGNCPNCQKGTYVNAKKQTSCIPCAKGTYNPSQGSRFIVDCLPCPAKTYGPNLGAQQLSNCLPCPPGKFNMDIGKEECQGNIDIWLKTPFVIIEQITFLGIINVVLFITSFYTSISYSRIVILKYSQYKYVFTITNNS